MNRKNGLVAAAAAAAGVGVGLAFQHSAVRRRRRSDLDRDEPFGARRGIRPRTIELPDGASIFVEEAGPESPRAAVFIHGSVLRTDSWHYQLTGIGDHRCVFYDLRGHGRSQPKGDSDFGMATLCRDLGVVLDEAGVEEAILVGHSVGGAIALDFCRRNPELLGTRVKGLALVATSYRPFAETTVGGAGLARIDRLMRHPLDALASRAPYVDRLRKIIRPSDTLFMAVSLAAFGPRGSAKQIDFTYDMLADTQSDVIFDLFKAYREYDMTEHLAEVTVPALVMSGTHDRITMHGASVHLAEHLPKAELEVFNECGHMVMLERHERFNEALEQFLNDHLGAREDSS